MNIDKTQNKYENQHKQNYPNGFTYSLEWIDQNREIFDSMPKNIQYRMFGTILFPMIKRYIEETGHSPNITPKVTGMLIDMYVLKVDDIIDSMKNQDVLETRIQEAIQLIQLCIQDN